MCPDLQTEDRKEEGVLAQADPPSESKRSDRMVDEGHQDKLTRGSKDDEQVRPDQQAE